ncbi:uncharacterized protein LOC143290557 [Babylonia areolata]|uniref:uncharacterized protein LOC143290557 n=1 Tax=Babylonia areolata TaxID=304850 RepID=UPI003FD5EF01
MVLLEQLFSGIPFLFLRLWVSMNHTSIFFRQQSTGAEWSVNVELVNYTAGHGAHQHVHLHPFFRVCQGDPQSLACDNSPPFNNTHTIDFGADGAAFYPPHIFPNMPANYSVDAKVMNRANGHNAAVIHFSPQFFSQTSMVVGAVIPVVMEKYNYRLVLNVRVQCNPPFKGPHCDCYPSGHQLCNDTTGLNYCAPGYTGSQCETVMAISGELECQNGGSKEPGTSKCQCPLGFFGTTCDMAANGCLLQPCQNGGRCIPNSDGTWACFCSYGYSGSSCEVDNTDPCSSSSSSSSGSAPYCQHGGICHSVLGTAYCHCPPGYKGERCEVEANECSSSPCLHGGTCIDEVNAFACTCPSGFMGHRCEIDLGKDPLVG